jgi:hypothetical protein
VIFTLIKEHHNNNNNSNNNNNNNNSVADSDSYHLMSDFWMIIGDELNRMWQNRVIAQFQAQILHLRGRTEKARKGFKENIPSSGRELNRISPKCKSEA